AVALSSNGKILASGGSDGTLRLWDRTTGKALRRVAVDTHGVRALAFTPDGKAVATGGASGATRLWDAASGEQIRSFDAPAGQPRRPTLWSLAFAPGGKVLAGGD